MFVYAKNVILYGNSIAINKERNSFRYKSSIFPIEVNVSKRL